MKKFIYKIVTQKIISNDAFIKQIDSLGQDGWELVSVTYEKDDGMGAKQRAFFFKKEKSESQ